MRFLIAAFAASSMLLGAAAAQAETHIFIIAEDDGYGVDNCLASGGPCGVTVANSYCHSREFATATSFRKVDRDDITNAISSSTSDACRGGSCDNFVAIECSR